MKADLRQVQAGFDALRPSIASGVRASFDLAEAEYTASIQSLIAQQSGQSQVAQREARVALLLRQRLNTNRTDPFSVCRQGSVTR